MSKKEVKAALAVYGYKIIKPSWNRYKGDNCVIFVAYDDCGVCHQFYINFGTRYARATMMTDTDVRLESRNVGFMFFEEGEA